MKRAIYVILILVFALSCKKDDNTDLVVVPPRVLSEVSAENDVEIKAFMQTHFYNYEEFANPPAGFDFKIKLDTIAGSNSDKTPLINQMESKSINVSASNLGLSEGEENIPFTYYYLVAREGEGKQPTYADSVYVKYEGSLLSSKLFDGQDVFSWQYLPFYVKGYAEGIANFRGGSEIIVNEDGTSEISGTGIGMIIMPSGLGYYNETKSIIAIYDPLIFKIELGLVIEDTDYDNDGIPSINEDLNEDRYLNNDNTDGDASSTGSLTNHLDSDDDNDGILTRDEISDDQGNIIFPYPDTDGDGTPDYLDADS
ncbi:MAG: hypothetical protein WBM83_06470 [Flavobacteriaceae bacterium]